MNLRSLRKYQLWLLRKYQSTAAALPVIMQQDDYQMAINLNADIF